MQLRDWQINSNPTAMNRKRKILFRADAGNTIGYGHFIRSLALADMLKEEFDCTFFTQIPTEYQKKEAMPVCRLVELPNDESKFQRFLDYLTGKEIVVLDNYFFTTDYQRAIKAKGCQLVCIDDMHDKHYVADVVINHGCHRAELFDVEPYTRLCLGLEWALLRKPFLEAAQQPRSPKHGDKIEKIVVCFGGSDTMHLTEKAITELLQIDDIKRIDAIVGNHFDAFQKFDDSSIHFHQNISAQAIADLFTACDLAVVSASSVCIEALACGAKVAAGWYVENQKEIYDLCVQSNLIIGLNHLSDASFISIFNSDMNRKNHSTTCNSLFTNIKNNYVNLFKSCH